MNEPTDATSILAPLWRRKWLILIVGVIVAAVSYVYYQHERPVYQSTTQIYLGTGSEEQAAGEKSNAKVQGSSISNQAALINSVIVEQVHKRLRAEHKKSLVKGSKIKAKALEKSQFITLTTQAHTARGSALLANATAQAYVSRQHATHVRVTERQIRISRRQLHRIEAGTSAKSAATAAKTVAKNAKGTEGKEKEAQEREKAALANSVDTGNVLQAANLNSKINQLEASLAQTGAEQIKPAKPATAVKLSPKPRKNAIFGFVIGIVLAAIAAYVLSRMDRRLRSIGGAESVSQARVIAALPKVRQPMVRREGRPMPSRLLLEPLRRLHTAIELAGAPAQNHVNSSQLDRERPPQDRGRVLVVTSPDAADGKSTLVAGLALVQRDANARVAIVEANFRRPVQARLLGIEAAHGLADVLSGGLGIHEAMQRVMPAVDPVGPMPVLAGAATATAVESPSAGSLFLLAGSSQVSNPPAMLADGGMREVLASLAREFDYVLVDAPSPLEVSDVMPLLAGADGVLVVARLGHTRELSAHRLGQVLAESSGAPVLGVVANCVPPAESARYGFSSSRGVPARLIGR
jgi:Mrp family chromosome partitioning ATPase/capsular polysaccharide biosynthesis protein